MTRAFQANEVICDYRGDLLNAKDSKTKYEATPEGQMGFMLVPGAGRLINHSRCHPNVIIYNCDLINST